MAMTVLWLLLGAASVAGVLWVVRPSPGGLDWAYVSAASAWVLWVALELWMADAAHPAVATPFARLCCQGMLLGAAVLLCHPAAVHPSHRRWQWAAFALMSGALAALGDPALWAMGGWDTRSLWLGLNALGGVAVVLVLLQELRVRSSALGWMALLIAISGLSALLSDWQALRADQWKVSGHHFFLMVALFAFWLASRRRMTDPPPTGWMDRGQLAQELHDGVGSQLVSILSTLDANSPQQRLTATSLQNCLLDLKLLVDGMDSDASLISHLASLRYRMHPLLERAGIRMEWLVASDARLVRVRGDAARHVLRLTQEALANVIHHSGASTVTVLCRYRPEIDSLLLCVADDGTGIAPERRASLGKGLPGMQRRARALGGHLSIESSADGGTVIQLQVPMARLQSGQGAPPRARPPTPSARGRG